MKYIILNSLDPKKLIDEVNKFIKDGWKPLGGVAVWHANIATNHYQAMIKNEEEVTSDE